MRQTYLELLTVLAQLLTKNIKLVKSKQDRLRTLSESQSNRREDEQEDSLVFSVSSRFETQNAYGSTIAKPKQCPPNWSNKAE